MSGADDTDRTDRKGGVSGADAAGADEAHGSPARGEYRDQALSLERYGDDGEPQARLYFERAGPVGAATVYYLHGGPGYNASSFRELMGDELSGYDVIYADARGGGRSPGVLGSDVDVLARDVEAVLAALEVDSVVLLAHGFGALVAAQLAASDPALVRRVVLVNPWISMPRLAHDLNAAARRLAGLAAEPGERIGDADGGPGDPFGLGEQAGTRDRGGGADGDTPLGDPGGLVDEALAMVNPKVLFDTLQFRSPAARLRLEHVDAVALSGEAADEVDPAIWQVERLAALRQAARAGVEVVVLSGAHDGTSYPAQAELVLEGAPDALFSLLDGAHYPWIDDAEAFVEVLLEALGPADA